jgi:Chalcone isomerase-like
MKKILLLLCCCISLSWNANALELAGVKVDDSAQVGNDAMLQLDGAGIRTKFIFRVYLGALQLGDRPVDDDLKEGMPGE